MTTRDEDELERFFAAARADAAEPSLALLGAILRDAATVTAERDPVREAPAVRAAPPPAGSTRLAPIGGWPGFAAMAACAVIGFWAGMAGNLSLDGMTLERSAGLGSQVASADDPVDAFYTLGTAEN